VFEVRGVGPGDGVDEAADGVGDDVATEPPVLHPAIPKTSTATPAANGVRTALQVKRLNCRFGYGLHADLRRPRRATPACESVAASAMRESRRIFSPRKDGLRTTDPIQAWFIAASAALVAICLIAVIVILERGAAVSFVDSVASGPVPYVFSLAALALLFVTLLQRRSRALLRRPRSLVGLAVGVVIVLAVVVVVNAISPYQDCGPGGNLVSVGSGHGVESRNGIQAITEQQYRSYLACGGIHSWLQAFAAAGVALSAQIVALGTRR